MPYLHTSALSKLISMKYLESYRGVQTYPLLELMNLISEWIEVSSKVRSTTLDHSPSAQRATSCALGFNSVISKDNR